MIKIELENNRNLAKELPLCYNCGKKVNDQTKKYCPNCHVILNPNDYIKWKKSWCGFLCCLGLLPFLIAFLTSLLIL